MESLRTCIVFGLANLYIIDTRYDGLQMGFYRPLPYPPFRTGKGWPISAPLVTYNKGTIKVRKKLLNRNARIRPVAARFRSR